ncbi:hypothetical protein Afil01_28550 [Actinorhabdospora filicis]|uniref:Uncharacterized protein n=1 Tax=Actinorhabdospora filicis TaxID=1785913 RepID=A0A9W6SKR7_9ACTN|nr:hypothetical protein [Actinorhabdospora filicis]GLZ78048.1 hypothetical protein Afil01_28550 [Actinorhabdospora filicis]
MSTVDTRERTPHDGTHFPDGNGGVCCATCTRAANRDNRSGPSVPWPCEPVKRLRRAAGLA